MTDYHFISHSNADGLDFSLQLHDALEGGTPPIKTWLDKTDMRPADKWDVQIDVAIKGCRTLLFVMTPDSIRPDNDCYNEIARALTYKKPVVPLRASKAVHDLPYRLQGRQWIDFSDDFEAGLAKLREYIIWLDTDAGQLSERRAERQDLERQRNRATSDSERLRIDNAFALLDPEIKRLEAIIADPVGSAKATEASIAARMELVRQPEAPVSGKATTRFINNLPSIPLYWQDRVLETAQVATFLKTPSQCIMTVVGRGGIGKTIMVSRLLDHLKRGVLPDTHEPLPCDGIVYLSEQGWHKLNFPNLFADLCLLLPKATAAALDALYKQPTIATADKMRALCEHFPADSDGAGYHGRTIILLDNLETLVKDGAITDADLHEALTALLDAPPHALKVIITTREMPRRLFLHKAQHQRRLELDKGLESPHAENILREMDVDGAAGLKARAEDDPLLHLARQRTMGYPRALEALYGALMADTSTRLDELLGRVEGTLPANVTEVLVGEAFSRLPTTSQRVMQALAIYGRPVPALAVDYLLEPFMSSMDSTATLKWLVNAHFARREGETYFLHPVDQAFAVGLIPKEVPPLAPPNALGGERLRGSSPSAPPNTAGEDPLRGSSPFAQQPSSASPFAANHAQSTPNADGAQSFPPIADSSRSLPPNADGAQSFPPIAMGGPRGDETPFTQRDLLLRGARYFRSARKPRDQYKTILDLEPQLAEIDLRCRAEDYDTAARILTEIDFHYLLLWGHFKLMMEQHERLQGKISDPTLKQISLGNLGSAYYSMGQVRKAINFYEAALASARESNNKQAEGAWLGGLGNAYKNLGEVRTAIDYHQQALAIARDIGDKGGEGIHLGNLGNAYADLGEVRTAIDYYQQALTIARDIGDKRGEGTCLGNLGNAYANLGEVRTAIDYYQQALTISRDIGDKRGEGNHLGNLGNAYKNLGEVRTAIDYHQQALTISRDIGDKRGEGSDLGSLGSAYKMLGDVPKAIEYIEQAVVIAREIGAKGSESTFLGNLGNRYMELGDLDKALGYYRQALALAREIGDRQGESIDTENIGHLLVDQGQLTEAMQHFSDAIRIADDISYPPVQSLARWGLAEAQLLAGDLSAAHATISDGLPYATEQNRPHLHALAGIIALHHADTSAAQQHFTAAIQHADALLAKTPDLYVALDSKGLALCGVAVATGSAAPHVEGAVAAFGAARAIFAGAGMVARLLRQYDLIAARDTADVLGAAVRSAAEGGADGG